MTETVKDPLQSAQDKLTNDMRAFEQTEGWKKLSQTQQRLLQQSLYFQSRSERAVESVTDETKPENDYTTSSKRIENWYCHAAVWSIENEQPFALESPMLDIIPDDFFDGDYFLPTTQEEIRNKILQVGFPTVVHIAHQPPPLTLLQTHTFLALGTRGDNVVVWEKQDEGLPFRRNTLSDVYRDHQDKQYYWGVRVIRKINS
jgi:hypothetical protein